MCSSDLALRQADMEERMFGYYPVTLNEDFKYKEFVNAGYTAGYGLSISADCKDPVGVIKFLDRMAEEDAQILLSWGIEGEHYTYDENGTRTLLPEIAEMKVTNPQFAKITGIDLFTTHFPTYGNMQIDSTGNTFVTESTDQIIAEQTEIEKEVLQAYGATTWKDLYPSSSEFPVKEYGFIFTISSDAISDPEIQAKDNRILEIGYRKLVEAILGTPEQFDATYNSYIEEVNKAGLAEVTAAYQQAIDERLELWR